MKTKRKILVIDDDRGHAETLAEVIEKEGHDCTLAFNGTDGSLALDRDDFDLIITDLVMNDLSGLEILRKAKGKSPEAEVLVVTGYASEETAIEALDEGASDYIAKPLKIPILRAKLRKALGRQDLVRSNNELRRQLDKRFGFEGIIGASHQMQKIFDTLQQVSSSTATVLITGESGTGKELVARAIHNNSARRDKHFVPLNCAALSESILESELFGHEKGAFTGATYTRKGRFEYADGGTLFLDEIGDMPMEIQVKLLRVIEYGEVFRVGSNESIRANVRLLAATNKDLATLVREGIFREDLYYRLKVVTIMIPPLRERLDDLPLIVNHFVQELSRLHQTPVESISSEAMKVLCEYTWPGNVRELRNCIESSVVLAKNKDLLLGDIPSYIREPEASPAAGLAALSGGNLNNAEQELIRQSLKVNDGNREGAAKMLGISERTLYRKIKRYGLN